MGSSIEQCKIQIGLDIDAVHNQQAVHRIKEGSNRAFGNPRSKIARRERRIRRQEEKAFQQKLDIALGGISVREDLFFDDENRMSEAQEATIDGFLKEIKTGIKASDGI